MLQQPTPEDFVLATGETHYVREFVEKSFAAVQIKIRQVMFLLSSPHLLSGIHSWEGKGVDEVGINVQTGNAIVRIDPRYFRPAEVEYVFRVFI
jgi:GDPmannose 4,6-dehydratase